MKSSKLYLLVSVPVIAGAIWWANRPSTLDLEVESFHKGAAISVAEVGTEQWPDSWVALTPGKQRLAAGGYFYKIKTSEGREKDGLVVLAKGTSKVVFK
jgi:hypothetical protein